MSGHTPGPWHECKAGNCTCGMVWSIPGDFPVCTVSGGSTFPVAVAHEHMADSPDDIYQSISPSEAVANARLIAAAPAMFEVLTTILSEARHHYAGCEPGLWKRMPPSLRKAIERAVPALASAGKGV